MHEQIQQEHFLNSLFALLDETFESHHGIFLDEKRLSSRPLKPFPLKKPLSRLEANALR
jgi:hypothetical protein